MLVMIRNHGCDDTTTGIEEFKTKEELNRFIEIIINLNQSSTYRCMPTIGLYEINYDDIRPAANSDFEDKNVFYFKKKPYVLSDDNMWIYDLEKDSADLIKRYMKEELF